MSAYERLWTRVAISFDETACWPWEGYRDRHGYGQIGVTNPRRLVYVHRLAWEDTNGPIPDGMLVCHSCDNPPCCNPAHLFLGTQGDNNHDSAVKERNSHGETHHWAKLTDAEVLEMRSLEGIVSWTGLQRRFHVSRMTVYHVLHRHTWKHLD